MQIIMTNKINQISSYVEASFWRRLWTCRQREYWM